MAEGINVLENVENKNVQDNYALIFLCDKYIFNENNNIEEDYDKKEKWKELWR